MKKILEIVHGNPMPKEQADAAMRTTFAQDAHDIVAAVVDVSGWTLRGVARLLKWTAFAGVSAFKFFYSGGLTEYILKATGHHFDPNASRLPKWEQPKIVVQEMPKAEHPKGTKIVDVEGNARAVALNFEMFENDGETPTHFEAEVLWGDVAHKATKTGVGAVTPADWHEMQHYSTKQRLSDIQAAEAIKPLWLQGMTAKQIADKTGYKEDLVKKYTTAFGRAAKHSPTSR